MKICGASNVGKVREENQDCYKAGRAGDGTFWMVMCDGMGGMSAGGMASKTVADFLEKAFCKSIPSLTDDRLQDFLISSVKKCNSELYKKSVVNNMLTMGTTLETAIIRNNTAHTLHCGDSRTYLINKRRIKLLTKDHSMVQELVDSGRITQDEAKNHPNKNIITHAIGIEQNTKLDYNSVRLVKGEMILMCSDGLSNLVEDTEMAEILYKTEFYDAPQALINCALEHGGTDNITAVIAKAE